MNKQVEINTQQLEMLTLTVMRYLAREGDKNLKARYLRWRKMGIGCITNELFEKYEHYQRYGWERA